MRVLLIEAPVATITAHSHLSPPLGLAYVAQHLLDAGHDVELIDLNLTGLNPARLTAARIEELTTAAALSLGMRNNA